MLTYRMIITWILFSITLVSLVYRLRRFELWCLNAFANFWAGGLIGAVSTVLLDVETLREETKLIEYHDHPYAWSLGIVAGCAAIIGLYLYGIVHLFCTFT